MARIVEGYAERAAGVRIGTIRELFAFNDWGWTRLLESASGLSDEQLDRPFEMGPGSLRETLNHLYAGERIWLDRWVGRESPRFRLDANGVSIAQLGDEHAALVAERNAWLDAADNGLMSRTLRFRDTTGRARVLSFGAMLMHICQHGSHHRAQAVNMIKRVGGTLPKFGADYIFMKLEHPNGTPCVLDVATIRAYYAFGDWATRVLHETASSLTNEQLDREFDIGLKTLRRTLTHIRHAEQWWMANWTEGPGTAFPNKDERVEIADNLRRFDDIAARRDAMLAGMNDGDLRRTVVATPRPEMRFEFPIGVTMLQLCHHGVHHRAQGLNMLRHVGAPVPEIDFLEPLERGYVE